MARSKNRRKVGPPAWFWAFVNRIKHDGLWAAYDPQTGTATVFDARRTGERLGVYDHAARVFRSRGGARCPPVVCRTIAALARGVRPTGPA